MANRYTLILILLCFFCFHPLQGQSKYTVSRIKFRENNTLSARKLLEQMNTIEASLLDRMVFWKNEPLFSPHLLEDDIGRIKTYYKRKGFLHASLDYQLEKDEARQKLYFGKTRITGRTHVSERFIRRKLSYKPGELYSADALDQTQQNIFYTDLFAYATARVKKDSIQGNRIPPCSC